MSNDSFIEMDVFTVRKAALAAIDNVERRRNESIEKLIQKKMNGWFFKRSYDEAKKLIENTEEYDLIKNVDYGLYELRIQKIVSACDMRIEDYKRKYPMRTPLYGEVNIHLSTDDAYELQPFIERLKK